MGTLAHNSPLTHTAVPADGVKPEIREEHQGSALAKHQTNVYVGDK